MTVAGLGVMSMIEWLGILVGGPLVVAFFYFVVFRGPRKHAAAARELRALGDAWGLTFTPAEAKGGIGRFVGVVEGYRVEILPDEATLLVHLEGDSPLTLSRNDGKVKLDLDDPNLDAFFKTRKLRQGADAVVPPVRDSLSRLLADRWRSIDMFDVRGAEIRLMPREGNTSNFTYLDAGFVQEVMPLVVGLAQALDEGGGSE